MLRTLAVRIGGKLLANNITRTAVPPPNGPGLRPDAPTTWAPGPPPPPHTAAKTSREPCDQHRLRCTEKMRRPARTINRPGRVWSTWVRAKAHAVILQGIQD